MENSLPKKLNGSVPPALHGQHHGTTRPARDIHDSPFAWFSKAVYRRILDRFTESDRVPVAVSVYVALCVLASDLQREEFTVKIAQIASYAGVSYKTAHLYLRELETAGLVGIKRSTVPGTKLDAPSTYMLLSVCSSDTAHCSSDIPLSNRGVRPLATEMIEESGKNNTEKKTRTQPAASALDGVFSAETIQSIYEAYPKKSGPNPSRSEVIAIRKALVRFSEPDPAATMLERVRQYAYHVSRQPPDYIKSVLNYFRDEHYTNVFLSLR